MRTVADARAWAVRQWRNHWPEWLAEPSPTGPSWPLSPPTEREFAGATAEVSHAVRQWRALALEDGVDVEWVDRSWPSFGRQQLPGRLSLTPTAAARLAGQAEAWALASAAAQQLRRAWPDADLGRALASSAKALARLSEDDLVRLLAVLGWLEAHPGSGLWERELPVAGVDTKWFERHRGAVEALIEAITGQGPGLRRHGVRFAVKLPEGAARPTEFAVDLDQLKALSLSPSRVLIVENLTTLHALPELPGTAAVHGMGFAAPALGEVPWVAAAEQWYWGDLDTYGFQILGLVRAALPGVRSVLMDAGTLHEQQRFAVREPRPFRGEIGHLSADDRRALALLRADDARLEQERIPREYAHRVLAQLARQVVGSP